MKKLTVIFLMGMLLMSCTKKENPFFMEWNTPFGVPPFALITDQDYLPAYVKGIEQEVKEIEAITANPEAPTFANTIEAMEKTGMLLRRVDNVFDNMIDANTNDQLQAIAQKVSPMLSKHYDEISMNAALFARVKAVYEQKDALNLNPEQIMLLTEYYKDFVRGGANLNDEQKEELKKINSELSVLTLKFGDNVLAEDNRFTLVIEDSADLAGLPASAIAAAAETAREKGQQGKWIFTLHKPSLIPFLQYSQKRELREKMFRAYNDRGNNNDEYDNKQILARIASLRVKSANLLGYKTHADFILEENMAKTPANVYNLLMQLWTPAQKRAKDEVREMQAIINAEGNDFKLEPWDWWYYAEKLKKAKYELDDELLRPYFKLENVRAGAFAVATKLYGITFTELADVPLYHPDVKAFEVKEADGTHIGILYTDYFPRASKRGGAWMDSFRKQSNFPATETPVICNVCNFTKPSGDTPSLLSMDEVETLFHEFGHALHGLLSNCTYYRLSGTSVPRDFVELPSQIMENWATEPEVLKSYAVHYQTGEPIPDELIEKIKNSSLFNQGFATVEYLAASILDMDWHTIADTTLRDAAAFEQQSLDKIGLISEIVSRYKSPFFRHIFAGGYSAGYYSYIWAEVLDADAFQAFKETSLFDQTTAQAFRENILAAGGTEDPMILYKRFRHAEPRIEPLLKKRGLD